MKHAQKTLAFYVEALLLTLFLLAALAVLVRLYSTAHHMGVQAQREAQASQIAASFTASTLAGEDVFNELLRGGEAATVTWSYAADGTRSEEGVYLATARLTPTPTQTGLLVAVQITVYPVDAPQGEPLCELTTQKYVPAYS